MGVRGDKEVGVEDGVKIENVKYFNFFCGVWRRSEVGSGEGLKL